MAETVTVEGSTLNETLKNAVTELGATSADELEWDYVRDHFQMGAWSVLLTAHLRSEEELAAIREVQVRADAGAAWLKGLLENFGTEAEVTAYVRRGEPGVTISSPEDGRLLVGKEGKNIKALEVLLHAAVGPMRLDVADTRPRDDRRRRDDDDDDRPRRRRDRDDDRRARGRGRDRDRDGDEGRREKDPERDAKLVEQAVALANEVLESGGKKKLEDLNSYERHLVHTAVREIEGVASRSVGRGRVRAVQILPAGDEGDDD